MYRDILLATDGSDGATRATEHCLDLARDLNATVHALAVIPSGGSKRDRIRSDPEREANAVLETVNSEADRIGVAITTELRSGDPCETIVEYARERSADLVVMGSTPPTRLGRLLRQDTTQCVLEQSSIPVLSVDADVEPETNVPEDADHRFACPGCDSSIHVTTETREAILEQGCVICGSDVTADAFS